MQAQTQEDKRKYTNLKIEPETRRLAKAAAGYLGEEYYTFVDTAIQERLVRLKNEGKIPF